MTETENDIPFGDDAVQPRPNAAPPLANAVQPPAPFPWPPAEGGSAIDALARTWSGASLAPARFFAAMPPERSPGPAIIYYLVLGIAVSGVQLFWRMAGSALGIGDPPVTDPAGMTPVVEFLLSPLLLLLSLFLAAGVTHIMLKMFGGANGSYGRTVRVFGYAYSPNLLGVIPYVGTVAGFIWMVVVAIIGLRAAHGTSTARTAAAVLIPLGIGLFFMLMMLLIVRAGGLLELPV